MVGIMQIMSRGEWSDGRLTVRCSSLNSVKLSIIYDSVLKHVSNCFKKNINYIDLYIISMILLNERVSTKFNTKKYYYCSIYSSIRLVLSR